MTMSLALTFLGLALLDSTSFGTSLVPLWLLLVPGKVRAGRMAAYLLTLVAAYFIAGVLVAAGASRLINLVEAMFDGLPTIFPMLALLALGTLLAVVGGVLLFRAVGQRGLPATSKLLKWRSQAMTASSSAALTKLAALAFAVEFATMVPYLAAIGMLTQADLSWPAVVMWIAVYCLIMVLPAGVLTIVRVATHERIEPTLRRLDDWLGRYSTAISGTAFTLVGIVVAIYAGLDLAS